MEIHKSKILKFIGIGSFAVLVIVLLLGFGIYKYQWQTNGAYVLTRVLPFPALLVDWELVPMHIYLNDLKTLNKYWKFQKDNTSVVLGIPEKKDIRNTLVDKLITEKIIQIYARKNQIKVSEEESYLEWEQLKTKPGAEQEITKFLGEAYGWSDKQFISRVLQPFLLQQKVVSTLIEQSEDTDLHLHNKALEIYLLAIEEGSNFEDLAKKYSQDLITGPKGGDLGYFGRGTLEPVLETKIFEMQIDQISEPIKSSFGYHVVKLEDKLLDESGVASKIRAKHILIQGFNFSNWLSKQKQEMSIFRLVI